MVVYVLKWDILPDKAEAYLKWVDGAIKRVLAVPGVVEFRAHRPAAGGPQVAVTYEFTDFTTWAAWYTSEQCQKALEKSRAYATNITAELFGHRPPFRNPSVRVNRRLSRGQGQERRAHQPLARDGPRTA